MCCSCLKWLEILFVKLDTQDLVSLTASGYSSTRLLLSASFVCCLKNVALSLEGKGK